MDETRLRPAWDGESLTLLERIFERHLDGHSLMNGAHDADRMRWLNFRTVTNKKWHHANIVLMGDAAHASHFTIGSGTRLAIEDAIELAARLHEHEDVRSALEAHAKERQAALLAPQSHARNSARWFENVPRYIGLEAPEFATLLNHRFSRLLAHMPPRGYYRLHRAAGRFPMLRKLRKWASSALRGLRSRARP